ncbi:MAG: TolB family protein [Bacteroidota bacterium]
MCHFIRHPTIIVFLILFFCSCKTKTKEIAYKPDITNFSTNLAFSNQDKLYYYTTEKKQLSIINNGYDANISPDGSYLAFTDYYKSKNPNAAGSDRRVAILNLKTGLKKIIDYPSEQCYGPVWSKDGTQIAFSVIVNQKWNIGLSINDKFIKILRPEINCNSISWTADNKSILTHTLDTLYIIDTSNIIKSKIPIKDIISSSNISSSTTFTLTPDNRYFIFNASNIDATFCTENEYHSDNPYAIFKCDIQNKKLMKLTPDDLFCGNYTIVDDLIYFTASPKCSDHQRNIYSISLTGQNLKPFLKNANDITLSRP